MKKHIKYLVYSFLLMLLSAYCSFAQKKDLSSITQLKYEMVLKEMNLSKETEKKFMPLYAKCSEETWEVRKKLKALEEGKDNSNPQKKIQEREQYKQQVLNIEKKYKEQFLKIITPAELDRMYKGEAKFRQRLLELKNNK